MYLNNAATTFPKPQKVVDAVARAVSSAPAEPGRSTTGSSSILKKCRQNIASLFGVDDLRRVILTHSATHAIFQAIHGIVGLAGPVRVLASDLEHNSVLRPLFHLEKNQQISHELLPANNNGLIEPEALSLALDSQPTALVCLTHASNVTGAIQPIPELARAAARFGVPLLVDAAQSAGCVPLCHRSLEGRTLVAMAGHKGLYGPQGTGALIVPDGDLHQSLVGGTGVRSDLSYHPPELPTRHEAGTPNIPGLAGLAAGTQFVLDRTVTALGAHRQQLVSALRQGLAELPGITLSPLPRDDGRAGIVSFNAESHDPGELGVMLAEGFEIAVRTGLHCAPRAHGGWSTEPKGTVRVSVAAFTTAEDVEGFLSALGRIL